MHSSRISNQNRAMKFVQHCFIILFVVGPSIFLIYVVGSLFIDFVVFNKMVNKRDDFHF